MPITIQDIQKIEKSKQEIKKEIYKKIYDLLSKKIKNSVDLGQKQVMLRIPTYLLGYPTYDVARAGNYIERQFLRGGFIVHRISNVDIYVSWNIKNNEKVKIKNDSESDFENESLPSLINLKKLASKYK
jgi:hypothetical protein